MKKKQEEMGGPTHSCICGHTVGKRMQRPEVNFLNFSLPYFWRQGLSLNVEPADLGRLSGQNTESLVSVSWLLGLRCA